MFKNIVKRNKCLLKSLSLLIDGAPANCFQFQGLGIWSAQPNSSSPTFEDSFNNSDAMLERINLKRRKNG